MLMRPFFGKQLAFALQLSIDKASSMQRCIPSAGLPTGIHVLVSMDKDTMIDATNVTHAVQLSVAPVFFLTAVAGMISAVAGRLARIIDRARIVEDRVRASTDEEFIDRGLRELNYLRTRGRIANGSIGLLTLCGFLIGLTIVLLFVGQAWSAQGQHIAVVSFLAGVASFIAALGCFMWETVLATDLLNFNVLETGRKMRH